MTAQHSAAQEQGFSSKQLPCKFLMTLETSNVNKHYIHTTSPYFFFPFVHGICLFCQLHSGRNQACPVARTPGARKPECQTPR